MAAIVLESFLGSEYDDSPSSYEFPERYRSSFAPLERGEQVIAVIYEPRGDDGRGRMSYVAFATISRVPYPTERRSGNGQRLWRVDYDGPAQPFSTPVPREPMGEPAESWLRAIPRGRSRNVATFGRAVRQLDDGDLARILELGNAEILGAHYPTADEHASPELLVAERARRLVSAIEREAKFRGEVLSAYGYRCTVSGLGLGSVSRTKPHGLLDAAHIRPVSRMGADVITNGLPLTPTLHRLFDVGLFTVAYDEGRAIVRTSPHLELGMIQVPERGFVMSLTDGLPLLLPPDPRSWPNPDQLLFHSRQVFRS